MSHHIQALIGSKALLETICLEFGVSKVVELPQDIGLLLVTEEFYDAIPAVGDPTRADEGFMFLDAKIKQLLVDNSADAAIGYIETDYWGGNGDQGAILAKNGDVIFGPQTGDGSINSALSLLGVKVTGSCHDEFDATGLGRFRSNEDWIEQPTFRRQPQETPTFIERVKSFLLGSKSRGS